MIKIILLLSTFMFGFSTFAAEKNKEAKPVRKIASDGNYSCFGTEPFWSLEIKNGKIMRYSDPITTNSQTKNILSSRETAGSNQGIAYSVTSGKNKDIAIIKYVGNCSDGMSDNSYPYDISFLTVDKKGVSLFFTGCCK